MWRRPTRTQSYVSRQYFGWGNHTIRGPWISLRRYCSVEETIRRAIVLFSAALLSLSAVAQKSDWPSAAPESAGIASSKLQSAEAAINANDYKKITSVLIARHGKLVYEKYFNGTDASTLRNTRSASK